ncbi:MAG: ferritin [Capnocytophaga sp.]|nr:ferritin [Capnocytophaga sp.]
MAKKDARQETSLNAEVVKLLNEQITKEAHASAIYLAMASWCDVNGFSKSAGFFYAQSEEEREHMLKIFHFLNDNGARALSPEVTKITHEYKTLHEVFEKTLEHEINVTTSIYAILSKARQENDFASENFLQWFVTEQLEEERQIRDILTLFDFTTAKDSPLALKLIDERIPFKG